MVLCFMYHSRPDFKAFFFWFVQFNFINSSKLHKSADDIHDEFPAKKKKKKKKVCVWIAK